MRKFMVFAIMLFVLSIAAVAQNNIGVGESATFKFCTKTDVFVDVRSTFTLADRAGNPHTYQYLGADAPSQRYGQIRLKDIASGETITLDYLYQAYAGGIKGAELAVGPSVKYYYLVLEGSPGSAATDARLMLYEDAAAQIPAGEEPVCSSYEIKIYQMGYDTKPFARLDINGVITDEMYEGDQYQLPDGAVLSIPDILYQDFAGGDQRVWFFIDGQEATEVFPTITAAPLETSPVGQAVDLSHYPELFVKNSKLNVYFVVGWDAPASDNLALTDVALAFQEAGYDIGHGQHTKLDGEVGNPLQTNLIVVGRVSENTVARLLGSVSLREGEGLIKLLEHNGYVQMLVTGYSAEDTRKAAKVLQNYKDYDLAGKEVVVTGSLSNPQVGTSAQPIVVQPEIQPEAPRPQPAPTPRVEAPVVACTNACKANGNCLPYGTRLVQDEKQIYCHIDGTLQEQQGLGGVCQNNYDCQSNQCSNSKCIDISEQLEETQGFLQKVLDWLKRVFG